MFVTKLPYQWSNLIFTRWKAAEQTASIDTLGARIAFARVTLGYECEKAFERCKLQKDQEKLKCKDQMYFPSKFGCYLDKPKKKMKFKAKKEKGKQIKKSTKPSKKKKKFFNKKSKKETTKPASKQIQK